MFFEKVKEIIAAQLNVDADKITMETDFVEDLDADSLDQVELIMAVEDEYNITVNEEVIQDIHTVGDIVKILEENVK